MNSSVDTSFHIGTFRQNSSTPLDRGNGSSSCGAATAGAWLYWALVATELRGGMIALDASCLTTRVPDMDFWIRSIRLIMVTELGYYWQEQTRQTVVSSQYQ